MSRATAHPPDEILDAVRRLVLDAGPRGASVAAIAAASGAPVGSIYHRFGSRDALLEELWMRTLARFQRAWLACLDEDHDDAVGTAAAMAGAAVGFAHTNPDDAQLLLTRPRDLFDLQSEYFATRLAEANAPVVAGLEQLAHRLFGAAHPFAVERLALAVIDVPHGALRRHNGRPPELLEMHVMSSAARLASAI